MSLADDRARATAMVDRWVAARRLRRRARRILDVRWVGPQQLVVVIGDLLLGFVQQCGQVFARLGGFGLPGGLIGRIPACGRGFGARRGLRVQVFLGCRHIQISNAERG